MTAEKASPTLALSVASVLVVDDTPAEVQVLGNMLLSHGYDVRFALNGRDALAAVEGDCPDVIMLDIQMPEMDGYEVCRQIKAGVRGADTPVIFISALDHAVDKVRAFEAGGADYVDKPFQVEEVLARMRHQLNLSRLQREMAAANRKLRELEQLKAMFAAMLIHDLRSPLAVISTTLQIVRAEPGVAALDVSQLLDLSSASMTKVLNLINDVLQLYRSDAQDAPLALESLEVEPLLRKCADEARVQGLPHNIGVALAVEPDLPALRVDASKLDRAINNLLANALKFSLAGSTVRLLARRVPPAAGQGEASVEISVADSGRGIAEIDLPFVFEPYRQAGGRTLGVGLGLTIAKRFVEMHGGTLTVRSQLGVGTVFTIRLSPTRG